MNINTFNEHFKRTEEGNVIIYRHDIKFPLEETGTVVTLDKLNKTIRIEGYQNNLSNRTYSGLNAIDLDQGWFEVLKELRGREFLNNETNKVLISKEIITLGDMSAAREHDLILEKVYKMLNEMDISFETYTNKEDETIAVYLFKLKEDYEIKEKKEVRETLFRGKRLDNGEWIYGYYAKLPHPVTAFLKDYIVEVKFDESDVVGNIEYILVDPETVGQFTGLLDNNGKKIFEDDILRTSYGDAGVVMYSDDNTAFVILFESETNPVGLGMDHYPKDIEIVGNTHDDK